MKTLEEIKATPRIMVQFAGNDGGIAEAHLLASKKSRPATVIFSYGGGWDHVSVSFRNRCPTWEEMQEIKMMFFYPDEVCFQYHPAESKYVNIHPYCLHIWRPQKAEIPTPPSWMVGARKGQSVEDTVQQGKAELSAMEQNP